MRLTILGWYGTETIGDRAILAGILYLFSKCIDSIEVRLGCLDTTLTERTLYEDGDFYKWCTSCRLLHLELFDSRLKKKCR